MKKIPLHSLIIVIGPDEDTIAPAAKGQIKKNLIDIGFKNYEIISVCDVIENLCGDYRRIDMLNTASNNIETIIDKKLSIGERVVLIGNFSLKNKRDIFTNIAKSYDVPVYYIVVDDGMYNTDTSYGRKQRENFRSNYKTFSRGDNGIASVIDMTTETDVIAIKKFNGDDSISFLKSTGFCGITNCGDVHGEHDLLVESIDWARSRGHLFMTTGDFVDYGPNNMKCINTIYERVMYGTAITTMGNHEKKILKWIDLYENGIDYSDKISLSEGNMITVNEFLNLSPSAFKVMATKFKAIVNQSRHHIIFGNNLFTHAAAEPGMFLSTTPRLVGKHEVMALYGEIDPINKKLANGYPNRIYEWVDRIPDKKTVIVGHDIRSKTKVPKYIGALGGTAIFMDTGSGKGGKLSSVDLRFNEAGDDLNVINFNMRP